MRICIVTLNFNGSEDTLKLLKSLGGQTDSDFELTVIDNASEETDFTHLQEVIHIPTSQVLGVGHRPLLGNSVVYPQMIRNAENLGFSGGNNVGIRQALQNSASWVVLLNNDTWVENDFMERLKAVLSVKTGVIGIPLIEGDRVAYCGKIQWLKPTLIHIPTCDVGYPQVYAIGGAVAIHKDVFEKIGLLDEKYFLYFEDADFSVRAAKNKIPISIIYDIMIYHKISTSTKKLGLPLLLRYHYRNALYFNLKNGPWYIKFLVWPWSWIIIAKQLTKLSLRKNSDQSKAILAGVIDFYKNKYGKI